MIHMEAVQAQIEITRQQIIRQLEDEISLFQQQQLDRPVERGKKEASWEMGAYQAVIERKLQLIANLS